MSLPEGDPTSDSNNGETLLGSSESTLPSSVPPQDYTIVADGEQLRQALNFVRRVLPPKQLIDPFEKDPEKLKLAPDQYLLLEALPNKDLIRLTTTNKIYTMCAEVDGHVEGNESIRVAVGWMLLYPAGSAPGDVTISVPRQGRLRINYPYNKDRDKIGTAALPSYNSNEFTATEAHFEPHFSIRAEHLKRAYQHLNYVISTKTSRADVKALQDKGILLEVSETAVRFAAVDGYQMAEYIAPLTAPAKVLSLMSLTASDLRHATLVQGEIEVGYSHLRSYGEPPTDPPTPKVGSKGKVEEESEMIVRPGRQHRLAFREAGRRTLRFLVNESPKFPETKELRAKLGISDDSGGFAWEASVPAGELKRTLGLQVVSHKGQSFDDTGIYERKPDDRHPFGTVLISNEAEQTLTVHRSDLLLSPDAAKGPWTSVMNASCSGDGSIRVNGYFVHRFISAFPNNAVLRLRANKGETALLINESQKEGQPGAVLLILALALRN